MKINMTFIYTVLFLTLFSTAKAESLKGKYELQTSKVDYLVTYLIKKADGESVASKGKGECATSCEFLVASPIKSFKSKDSNRDSNMLGVTKADKFPLAVARITTKNELLNNELLADLEIEFSGSKHLYKNILFKASIIGNVLHVEGKFDLILSEHHIERPSLLGVEIKDLVPVTISADWKKL